MLLSLTYNIARLIATSPNCDDSIYAYLNLNASISLSSNF